MCFIKPLQTTTDGTESAAYQHTATAPRAAYVGCSDTTSLLTSDPGILDLIEAMEQIARKFDRGMPPSAIVVVSPHWQTQEVTVTSAWHPALEYDYSELSTEYGGLPHPQGSPHVAKRIQSLLKNGGVNCEADSQALLGDSVIGPAALMFPGVPVVSMSILSSMSIDEHIRIGTLLRPLVDEGVYFLGLGCSSNNLDFCEVEGDPLVLRFAEDFKESLDKMVVGQKGGDASEALRRWDSLPSARFNHPTEDHLMPLLLVAAAAGDARVSQVDATFVGLPISNYVFA